MRLVGKGQSGKAEPSEPGRHALFAECANPRCSTGWMRLWRSRRVPGFEGRWACSAECMEERVAAAVRREMEGGASAPASHPHRVPMGLMLIEQGKISPEQLRETLDTQKRAAMETGETVRLGEWLIRSGLLSEPALARVLSAQWNCPVFSLDGYHPEEVSSAMPRFLSEALGAIPVSARAGRLLYIAFAGQIDRSLSYAIERMTGLRVAAGVVCDSQFQSAQASFFSIAAPRVRFLEAASSWGLVRAITRLIESEKPLEARLARIHEYYWLRIWHRPVDEVGLPAPEAVEDVLCTVGTTRESSS